jgi:homoserine kinase
VRSKSILGFSEIKNAAMKAGALGCSISGSGPSLFALSKSKSTANIVGQAMKDACNKEGINSNIYISEINKGGARVISQNE